MVSGWPLSILGCFLPMLALAVLAACARTLWLTLTPPSRIPAEPSCGRCGYPATGLETAKCPECGADLRVVGVNTRALVFKHCGSVWGGIVAWSILAACAGFIAVSFVSVTYTRRVASRISAAPPTWTTPLYPNSKGYVSVDVTSGMSAGRAGGPTTISLDLKLADGSAWAMAIDPKARTYSVSDPTGRMTVTGSAFSPSVVVQLFKGAGLDTADPKLAAEAKELGTVADLLVMSPLSQPSQMNLTEFAAGTPTFSRPAAPGSALGASGSDAGGLTVMLLGAVGWLVMYLVGIWAIIARRKTVLARLGA